MMVLHSFTHENIEYLICRESCMAAAEKIALLCSHTEGVGADKVLCLADGVWHVFLADGSETSLTDAEAAFLASPELLAEAADAEVRLTNSFCRKLGLEAENIQMAG